MTCKPPKEDNSEHTYRECNPASGSKRIIGLLSRLNVPESARFDTTEAVSVSSSLLQGLKTNTGEMSMSCGLWMSKARCIRRSGSARRIKFGASAHC